MPPAMDTSPAIAPTQPNPNDDQQQDQQQQPNAGAIAAKHGTQDGVSEAMSPSHILENGMFVYLPPPTDGERSRFFERSIGRHALLESDMAGASGKSGADAEGKDDGDAASDGNADAAAVASQTAGYTSTQNKEEAGNEEESENQKKKSKTPKVHPLAIASAKLQTSGLSELNRAINLAGLVSTGEYLGLSTIVDPSLEVEDGTATNPTSKGHKTNAGDVLEEAKTRSTFVLKRKRSQFERASTVLERHRKRLEASIAAQAVMDRRMFQLRQQWRLVAPEHGTRARLHPARPTEVVAIDVDIYDNDRVGGGNQALQKQSNASVASRLASRVPRYATIELKDDFTTDDLEIQPRFKFMPDMEKAEQPSEDKMDVDEDNDAKGNSGKAKEATMSSPSDAQKETTSQSPAAFKNCTKAEPFVIADPTLGRIQENVDPNKVPMLTLELSIQKSSTNFKQSACLSPMTTVSVAKGDAKAYAGDEQLLVSLQHSLFCAHLFESMRHELDEEEMLQSEKQQRKKSHKIRWLSCESEENFLPSPSVLAGGDPSLGLAPLAVIHCHDGEVKVQLDIEYTLCVRLVETSSHNSASTSPNVDDATSGSQSPARLLALCRALLLHAQDVYHTHSLQVRAKQRKEQQEKAKAALRQPSGLAMREKQHKKESPKILQSCVGFGAKILFEYRIRKVLNRASKRANHKDSSGGQQQSAPAFAVSWSPFSIFGQQSHFTMTCGTRVWDGFILRDSVTLSSLSAGVHRKVRFHSDEEFELYLKLQMRKL